MKLRIRAVDPTDRVMFPVWYETFSAALAAGRPDPPSHTYRESRADLARASPYARKQAFLAMCGDIPVGAAITELPLRDNPELMVFRLGVLPERRCRGAGRALHRYLCDIARAERRHRLLTEIDVPLEDSASDPGVRFATASGFTLRNVEVRRRLRLPAEERALDRWENAGCPDYDIVGWTGSCPDGFAQQYALLRGLMMVEAPTGELDYERELWDVERLRDEEARNLQQGRALLTAAAVAPDVSLAGHTVMAVPVEGDRAYQWDTLVLPAHRGRRLGLALKAANLKRLQSEYPAIGFVETANAEQNGPMVAINELLGFRPVELCQAWQRDMESHDEGTGVRGEQRRPSAATPDRRSHR